MMKKNIHECKHWKTRAVYQNSCTPSKPLICDDCGVQINLVAIESNILSKHDQFSNEPSTDQENYNKIIDDLIELQMESAPINSQLVTDKMMVIDNFSTHNECGEKPNVNKKTHMFEHTSIPSLLSHLQQRIDGTEGSVPVNTSQPSMIINNKINCLQQKVLDKNKSSSKAVQCKKCLRYFFSVRMLKIHLQVTHEKILPFECDMCFKKQYSANAAFSHAKIHEEARYPCTQCYRMFTVKHQLKNHINKCHKITADTSFSSTLPSQKLQGSTHDDSLKNSQSVEVEVMQTPNIKGHISANKSAISCLPSKPQTKTQNIINNKSSISDSLNKSQSQRSNVSMSNVNKSLISHNPNKGQKPQKPNPKIHNDVATKSALSHHSSVSQTLKMPNIEVSQCSDDAKMLKTHDTKIPVSMKLQKPAFNGVTPYNYNKTKPIQKTENKLHIATKRSVLPTMISSSDIINNHVETNKKEFLNTNLLPKVKHLNQDAHKKVTTKVISFKTDNKCSKCDKKFINTKLMQIHFQIMHNNILPYECDLCGKTQPSYRSALDHAKKHINNKSIPCEYCNKSFYNMSVKKDHIQNEHNNIETFDKCLAKVSKTQLLQKPDININVAAEKSFMPFNINERQAPIDVDAFVDGNKSMISCDLNKTVKLQIPINMNITDNNSVVSCESIESHNNIIEDITVKSVSSQLNNALTHQTIVGPSECDKHNEIITVIENDLPVQLKENSTFMISSSGIINSHIRTINKNLVNSKELPEVLHLNQNAHRTVSSKITSYMTDNKCSKCDKHFANPKLVQIHFQIKHNNILPYECDFCGKTQPSYRSALDHARKHINNKSIPCEHCSKSFYSMSMKKDHIQNEHTNVEIFDKCLAKVSKTQLLQKPDININVAAEKSFTPFSINERQAPIDVDVCVDGNKSMISCDLNKTVKLQIPINMNITDNNSVVSCESIESHNNIIEDTTVKSVSSQLNNALTHQTIVGPSECDKHNESIPVIEKDCPVQLKEDPLVMISSSGVINSHVETNNKKLVNSKELPEVLNLNQNAHRSVSTNITSYMVDNKCSKCDKQFANPKLVQIHFQIMHNNILPYECDLCGKTQPSHRSALDHAKKHINNKRIPCKHCNMSFYSMSMKRDHIQNKHNNIETFDKCLAKVSKTQLLQKPDINIDMAANKSFTPFSINERQATINVDACVDGNKSMISCDVNKTVKPQIPIDMHITDNNSVVSCESIESHNSIIEDSAVKSVSSQLNNAHLTIVGPSECSEHKKIITENQNDLSVQLKEDPPFMISSSDLINSHIRTNRKKLVNTDQLPDVLHLNQNVYKHEMVTNKFKKVEGSATCHNCNMQFPNLKLMHIHFQIIHNKILPYECDLCGRKQSSYQLAFNHATKHINSKSLTCKHCKKSFYNVSLRAGHMKKEHGLVEKYQCDICHNWYKFLHTLNYHKERVHQIQSSPCDNFVPSFCALKSSKSIPSRVLPSRKTLSSHKEMYKFPYQCDICDKPFYHKYLLNRHSCKVCEHEMLCHYCDIVLKTMTSISDHVNLHDGINMYACIKCNRIYSCKNEMNNYVWVLPKDNHEMPSMVPIVEQQIQKQQTNSQHDNERTKHEDKSKTYNNKSSVSSSVKHQQTREQQIKPQIKECTEQDNVPPNIHHNDKSALPTFSDETQIKQTLPGQLKDSAIVSSTDKVIKHKNTHHKKLAKTIQSNNILPRYQNKQKAVSHGNTLLGNNTKCHICGKLFFNLKVMEIHIQIVHFNILPFKCDLCGKIYRNVKTALDHAKMHAMFECFSCKHCDKKFYKSSTLVYHMSREHKVVSFQCDQCNRLYSSPSSLYAHKYLKHKAIPKPVQIHTDEIKVEANQCVVSYDQNDVSDTASMFSETDERPISTKGSHLIEHDVPVLMSSQMMDKPEKCIIHIDKVQIDESKCVVSHEQNDVLDVASMCSETDERPISTKGSHLIEHDVPVLMSSQMMDKPEKCIIHIDESKCVVSHEQNDVLDVASMCSETDERPTSTKGSHLIQHDDVPMPMSLQIMDKPEKCFIHIDKMQIDGSKCVVSHEQNDVSDVASMCSEADEKQTSTKGSHLIQHDDVPVPMSSQIMDKPEKCIGNKMTTQTEIMIPDNESLSTNNSTPCSYCNMSFVNSKLMNTHVWEAHNKLMPFECDLCGEKQFTLLDAFKHTNLHAMNYRHICDHCEKEFFKQSHLLVHVSKYHKQFIKFECDKEYKTPKSLKSHESLKTKKKRSIVDYDNYSKKKMKKYENEKNNKKSHLFAHVNKYHKVFHRFQCNFCEKKCKTLKLLELHNAFMHVKSLKTVKKCDIINNTYMCVTCPNLSFKFKVELRMHMKTHHGFQHPTN